MGAKENLQLIEDMQDAARSGDWDRYGQHLADDVTLRMAGVPRGLGRCHRGPGGRRGHDSAEPGRNIRTT